MKLQIYSSFIFFVLSACTVSSQRQASAPLQPKDNTSTTQQITTGSSSIPVPSFKISTIRETRSSINSKPYLQLTLDTSSSGPLVTSAISSHCYTHSSQLQEKGCLCRITWDETNTKSPGTLGVKYKRTVYSPITTVQTALAICEAPGPYQVDEIGLNQEMTIDIVPVKKHLLPFTTNTVIFRRPTQETDNRDTNFEDTQGNKFLNILRYTCYEKFRRGAEITSKSVNGTFIPPHNNPNGNSLFAESKPVTYASQFSVRRFNDSNPVLATQQNYFNLYFPNGSQGSLSPSNSTVSCPRVSSKYFPGDSSFALATRPSRTFPVPVEARSRVARPGETHEFCEGSPGREANPQRDPTFINSCLGYAAPTRPDGTCESLTRVRRDSQANMIIEQVPMFRLRRFNALYPPMYDSDGRSIQNRHAQVDQIYVLDRPATVNNRPVAIHGPKPCPYAWYDFKNKSYRPTNDSWWLGRNPDGLNLPVDTIDGSSCPAVLPVNVSSDPAKPLFRIKSLLAQDLVPKEVDLQNRSLKKAGDAVIRPIQTVWEPVYLEDTDFRACTPEPSDRETFPVVPVHQIRFADGTSSYCEEAYPTKHRGAFSTRHSSREYAAETSTSEIAIFDQAPLLAPLGGPSGSSEDLSNVSSRYPIQEQIGLPQSSTLHPPGWDSGELGNGSGGIRKALYNRQVYGCRTDTGAYPTGGCCVGQNEHQDHCLPPQ